MNLIPASLVPYYPLIILGAMGFVILLIGILRLKSIVYAALAFASLVVVFFAMLFEPENVTLTNFMEYNQFTIYFALLFIVASALVVFPAMKNVGDRGEIFYALLLFVAVGMIVAALSYNLITLFIAFESVSIGTYVIAGYHRTKRTLESATKYFFTGTVATSFIVFGIAYFFLSTGTLNLTSGITVKSVPNMLVALAFMVIGFGFKVAIFPMHQWAIDTYDGTENAVSAFLSTGSKLVAFMIMLKVFLIGFAGISSYVYVFFTILAVATMTYANLAAVSQNNMKRLLAYSSVAQAGYLILVFSVISYSSGTSAQSFALAAGMLYSLIYIFMKGGAFFAMNLVKKEKVMLEDLSGLAKKSPVSAFAISFLLLGLAGIPLTGGFIAKFYLFLSLVQGGLWWLAIIAILNSAISVFYYFRVIVYMYWKDSDGTQFDLSRSAKAPVYLSTAIVIATFFYFNILFAILPMAKAFLGGG